MMDLFNLVFQICACIFLTLDCKAIRQHRILLGASLTARIFFTIWSLFNLPFFITMGLPFSFIGACAISAISLIWLGFYAYYQITVWMLRKRVIKRYEQRNYREPVYDDAYYARKAAASTDDSWSKEGGSCGLPSTPRGYNNSIQGNSAYSNPKMSRVGPFVRDQEAKKYPGLVPIGPTETGYEGLEGR